MQTENLLAILMAVLYEMSQLGGQHKEPACQETQTFHNLHHKQTAACHGKNHWWIQHHNTASPME